MFNFISNHDDISRDDEFGTRLISIADTLKGKRSLIEDIDQKILDCCDIEEVDKEVEETTEIARGINITLIKIVKALKGNTAESRAPNLQSTPRRVEITPLAEHERNFTSNVSSVNQVPSRR